MTVVCFPDDFTVHPGTAYVHEAPLDTFFFTQVSFHLIPTVPSCCFFLHFKQQLRGRQCLTVKVMNDSHCDPGTHDVSVTLKVINSDPRQLWLDIGLCQSYIYGWQRVVKKQLKVSKTVFNDSEYFPQRHHLQWPHLVWPHHPSLSTELVTRTAMVKIRTLPSQNISFPCAGVWFDGKALSVSVQIRANVWGFTNLCYLA